MRTRADNAGSNALSSNPAYGRIQIGTHVGALVRRPAVEHRMNRSLAMARHLLEQIDEQRKQRCVERTLIDGKTRTPRRIDRRTLLALTPALHHRGVCSAQPPSLAMHRIGVEALFLPGEDVGAFAPSVRNDRGEALALPASMTSLEPCVAGGAMKTTGAIASAGFSPSRPRANAMLGSLRAS
jgi:hypothetical protein